MRSQFFALLISPLFLAAGHRLLAQADTSKYKERAALVDQEVWGWKVPAFANHNVPADYSGESSVVLARRATIEADSKKRMNWLGGLDRKFYYNSTVRELVKIN